MFHRCVMISLLVASLANCAPQIQDSLQTGSSSSSVSTGPGSSSSSSNSLSSSPNSNSSLGNSSEIFPVEIVQIDIFEIEERNECRNDSDCPVFNYCYNEVFSGLTCQTNNEEELDPIVCKGTDKSGHHFPQHDVCRMAETNITGTNETYTTARCYKELNYTCAKSYFMPCTANHDHDGNVIQGEEESCPNHFKCVDQQYGSGSNSTTVKLCAPVQPLQPVRDFSPCASNFDCGYSTHIDEWTRCLDKTCFKLFEKK